ncbi:M6 family metalloprotease domain-containing protein, partial [Micromonospora sp. DT81.3]
MASPFDGEIFTFVNPDGSQVTLRGWGNQFEAVFETLEGYTVVHADDGYYQYAKLSGDGETLVPTGTRVGEEGREALPLPKHVRVTREAARAHTERAQAAMGSVPRWMERRREDRARRAAEPPDGVTPQGAPEGPGGAPPSAATTGDYLGLVLLIDFSDFPQTISRQQVDDFCNKPGYSGFGNNGSAFDYFRDVSDGKLRYKNHVAAYFRAARPRTYYTDRTIKYGTRAQELIREALDGLVASGFNFSGLTADSGGFIQALSVFYAGVRSNAWSEGLWPHAWGLANTYSVDGGRRFRDYQITDLGDELTLRTFCHENGHMVCDFPDLYDYDKVNVGNGIGHYSLMCFGGSNKNPTQVDAYLKHAAGWASRVTTLAGGMTATVEAGKNDFLIHPRNASEYFILENRQQSGRDAALPAAGVAIWHVDVNGDNSHEQMTPTEHYECSLEQADNRFDLERRVNAGDAEDLYGRAAVAFGAATGPNSNWWDGSASGLEIEQISAVSASMTVHTRGAGPAEVVYGGKDIALVRQTPGWAS